MNSRGDMPTASEKRLEKYWVTRKRPQKAGPATTRQKTAQNEAGRHWKDDGAFDENQNDGRHGKAG